MLLFRLFFFFFLSHFLLALLRVVGCAGCWLLVCASCWLSWLLVTSCQLLAGWLRGSWLSCASGLQIVLGAA